jgi:hypothetical protein
MRILYIIFDEMFLKQMLEKVVRKLIATITILSNFEYYLCENSDSILFFLPLLTLNNYVHTMTPFL